MKNTVRARSSFPSCRRHVADHTIQAALWRPVACGEGHAASLFLGHPPSLSSMAVVLQRGRFAILRSPAVESPGLPPRFLPADPAGCGWKRAARARARTREHAHQSLFQCACVLRRGRSWWHLSIHQSPDHSSRATSSLARSRSKSC
jgi:hypothetical protein